MPRKDKQKGREYARMWYQKNREKLIERARQWRLKNPEKSSANSIRYYTKDKDRSNNWRIRRLYGISLADYNTMFEAQNGVCKICGTPPDSNGKIKRLHIDHDHKTGKVRGLLCVTCNTGLGFVEAGVEKFINYLKGEKNG